MSAGPPPPSLKAIPRLQDRLSFLYVEHCVVHRDQNALTLRDEKGVVRVPASALGVILLGPGTTISHQAMVVLGSCGGSVAWTGESTVRVYASGRALSRSNRLLNAQARLSSNQRSRLAVARQMYEMRFPSEDVSALTMQQLRGREGARIRRLYREESARTGVEWARRDYDPEAFSDSDPVNQALSAANAALYGVMHAAVVGLGLSPGLGFVHEGTDFCFLYDIADLYKAETSIPVAFETVKIGPDDIAGTARRLMRDLVFDKKLLERSVADMQMLLGADKDDKAMMANVITLWDLQEGTLAGGTNYSDSAGDIA